jgi:hypothetical protein
MLFVGKGKVMLAERDSGGNPGVFRRLGSVSALGLTPQVESIEHVESESGLNAVDGRVRTTRKLEISATLDNHKKENLALAVHGNVVAQASGTASDEAFPTTVDVGDIIALAHVDVSSVVIQDSAGTPATLTVDTDYTLNAEHGSITMLDLGAYTQPFKASYSYAASDAVGIFTDDGKEYALRFEGLNLANKDKSTQPVLVKLHKVDFDPTGGLQLIQSEFGTFELKGPVLQDTDKAADSELGQFGEIVLLKAS